MRAPVQLSLPAIQLGIQLPAWAIGLQRHFTYLRQACRQTGQIGRRLIGSQAQNRRAWNVCTNTHRVRYRGGMWVFSIYIFCTFDGYFRHTLLICGKDTLFEFNYVFQSGPQMQMRKKKFTWVFSNTYPMLLVPHYLSWKTQKEKCFNKGQGQRGHHGEEARFLVPKFIHLPVHIDATLDLSCLGFMQSCPCKAALAKLVCKATLAKLPSQSCPRKAALAKLPSQVKLPKITLGFKYSQTWQ